MDTFLAFIKSGFYFFVDVKQYLLWISLVLLSLPYAFKDWKRLLWLILSLSLGQFLGEVLSYYDVVKLNSNVIRLLLLTGIFISGCYSIIVYSAKNLKNEKVTIVYFFVSYLGFLLGLTFNPFLHKIIFGDFMPTIGRISSFTTGIILVELFSMIFLMIVSYLFQHFFKINKRDWLMVLSSIIIGFVLYESLLKLSLI